MINLKKIAAVTLVATMCMGLSVTAFAAPGTDNNADPAATPNGSAQATLNNWNPDSRFYVPASTNTGAQNGNGVSVDATNGDGETNNELTISKDGIRPDSESYDSINTTQEVFDIIKENGLKTNANSISPEAVVLVTGLSEDMDNVLTFALGADFSTEVYDESKYHPGDEIWGMFETGENTGVWEMRSGIINGEGKVDFTVDHKGAVILLKTMRNGKIVAIEKDGNGNEQPPVVIDPENPGTTVTPTNPAKPGTSTNAAAGAATTGTSPKTGEF